MNHFNMKNDLKSQIGKALVSIRWKKATKEQRFRQGQLMSKARWNKYRQQTLTLKGDLEGVEVEKYTK